MAALGANPEQPAERPAERPALDPSDQPIGRLRGARVSADARRVGLGVSVILLVGLAVLVIVLLVAGARKNGQIDDLRDRGVPVQMTIVGCVGLLGGSGSNGAGYSCHGTFALGGTTHDDPVPGDGLYEPGSRIAGITVADDTALFTTPARLRVEHASWHVFVVPTVLALVLVGGAGCVAVVVARGRRQGGDQAT